VASNSSQLNLGKPLASPREISPIDCPKLHKEVLTYRGDMTIEKKLFPDLFDCYGEVFSVELAST